ncbi:EAL domain-containing protein [Leucothrix arctica]|uniref:EAL domain-containing protein n=1 Tax=Leucothrix arctica TaxID=1481894 RepID=A0A317CRQ1_9GAMM|nr:EAL domain-containing protein [Leucothrix arctica]PWQ98982.1 hypothetical protein DKT75_02155 [Leucothrix arctica]
MTISPLEIMLIGFTDEQHQLVLDELLSTGVPAKLNLLDTVKSGGHSEVDVVNDVAFLYRKSIEQPLPLFKYLHKRNPDCIAVEVLPPDHKYFGDSSQDLLQSCRIIYAPEREEFQLALQFVLQYSLLKRDFRHCKSLLNLSEKRVLKLVNTSTHAVAYLSKGQFVHANIAFLALFGADSIDELSRFPLLKLIDKEEKGLLADYLAMANKSGGLDVGLTLSMKKVSGIPFNSTVSVAPVVYQGQRCYQMWVAPTTLSPKFDVIPVAQALNVWELPGEEKEGVVKNPFDKVIGVSSQDEAEKRLDALLKGIQHDDVAKLGLRELYDLKKGPLNSTWVVLDVNPEEFNKINLLLAPMTSSNKSKHSLENFWDQLLFRLVFDALVHERQSRRFYYMELSVSAIRNEALMAQLVTLASALEQKSSQLRIVFDAAVSMDVIPQLAAVAGSLRALNCGIVLDNFSVETTPLYLYRKLQPDCVFFDKYWLESLKEKQDGWVFLSRFVQQLESKDVSVMLPQTLQKRQDRLLVLSGTSFGQEKTTKHRA